MAAESEQAISVTAHLGLGTRVELRARGFTWVGDEPPDVGGTDAGPSPYELLLGSLAACMAATLRLYARHKEIELSAIDVRLGFDRVHADDCTDCGERSDGWIDRVRTAVTIHGTFDEAQRRRLEQVARRCPVHKTLTNGMTILDDVAFVAAT